MTPIANPAPSVPETVVVTPAPLTPAEARRMRGYSSNDS